MRRKFAMVMTAILGWAALSGAAPGGWRPTAADIARAEAAIKMPPRAAVLTAYKRYYAGEIVDGQRRLRGTYLRRIGTNDPGIEILDSVAKLPIIFDGGCGVVEVRFDLTSGTPTADCHGYA